jgi:hypothetical protein
MIITLFDLQLYASLYFSPLVLLAFDEDSKFLLADGTDVLLFCAHLAYFLSVELVVFNGRDEGSSSR